MATPPNSRLAARTLRALGVVLVTAAVAACSDTPTSAPMPEVAPPTMSLQAQIQERLAALPPASSRGPLAPARAVIVDPDDPNTVTYDFNELPVNCMWNAELPNPYEDLTFINVPRLAPCLTPNGTVGLVPADLDFWGWTHGIGIDLPTAATTVSIETYNASLHHGIPKLQAHDADDNLIDFDTDNSLGTWSTLSVTGDIHRILLVMPQGWNYLDNLRITFAPTDPQTKDECKDGGWEAFGFKNQGQCVRFVETGKDSR